MSMPKRLDLGRQPHWLCPEGTLKKDVDRVRFSLVVSHHLLSPGGARA